MGQRTSGTSINSHRTGLKSSCPRCSSLEYDVALYLAYLLIRCAFPNARVGRGSRSLVTVLCLALGGNLFRMPLMQLVAGNPVLVTLVQHAGLWMPYLAASLVIAYTYEWLVAGKLVLSWPGKRAGERLPARL